MSHVTRSGTDESWTRFVESGEVDAKRVRPAVAASWERCRSQAVDPLQTRKSLVAPTDLRERHYRNQQLMSIARPLMDNLYQFVRGSGFQVVLTDEEGVLLHVLGDPGIVTRTKAVELCPGGIWSEPAKGTNAIGTAIIECKPVQICGWEHFCQPHHFLTCSASPILDPEGRLIGVLDISGDCRLANAHTLGMVVAAVSAIENRLGLQKATTRLYIDNRHYHAIFDNMSQGVMSVDDAGLITGINAKGAQLTGVNPDQAKGRHISEVFSSRLPLLGVLTDRVGYDDKEITIEATGRRLLSSASLLRDDAGGVIGAVAVFRDRPPRPHQVPPERRYTFDDIIGETPGILEMKQWAELAAASPFAILIKGESGTGKELLAQAIHSASLRRDGPFVPLNSAALPESLIESELFGHEAGAFTGARRGGYAGKFELADGGTLFLDEVGDMPLSAQTKLLRVLQEKRFCRVGSSVERKVDVRVISATNKDLLAEVKRGAFRLDLYYRLCGLEVTIPPLRERLDDVPLLAAHLIRRIAAEMGREARRPDDGFVARLKTYSWPGNVRELENVIERAMVRAAADGVLRPELLALSSEDGPAPPARAGVAHIKSLRDVEREAIIEALTVCRGNIQMASSKLGIGRNTLYRKMKDFDIS